MKLWIPYYFNVVIETSKQSQGNRPTHSRVGFSKLDTYNFSFNIEGELEAMAKQF